MHGVMMEDKFNWLVKEFRSIVAFQQAGKQANATETEMKVIRNRIGKLVDTAAELCAGWSYPSTRGLPMGLAAVTMSCIRKDMYDKLYDEGIIYSHYVSHGQIAAQMTDTESGVCVYRGLTDEYPEIALQKLMNHTVMDHVVLH